MSFGSAFFNGIHTAANEFLGDTRYFLHNPSFESFLPIWYSNSKAYELFGSDPSTSLSPELTQYLDDLQSQSSEGAKKLPGSGRVPLPGGSPPSGYYPAPSAQQIDYLYADLSKHYGMDKATAYNEAMANTAYQRAVADMQMAGLNPASLFSASRASTAGAGYASGHASGGYSSAKGSTSDQLPGWIYFGLPALTQAVVTGATKNVSYGVVASQVAQNFLKAFNGTK